MMEMIPDLFRGSVTGIFVVLTMFVLAQPKYSEKKTLLVMLILIGFDFFRNVWCYIQKDYTLLAKLDLLFLLIIFAFAKAFFKESIMQWIFNCVTTINIYASVVFLSYWGRDFFPHPQYANTILRILLFSVILFALYCFGRKLYREVKKYWYIFLFPVTAIFLNFAWFFISCDDVQVMLSQNTIEFFMLILIAVGVYLSIFYSLKITSEKASLQEENIKNGIREQFLQAEMFSYEESMFLAKKSRHDLRHHNAVVLEYLNEKNIEGAKDYLRDQNKDLEETAFHDFCANPIANAVFRMYERYAYRSHIPFTISTQIPKELPLTSPELGAMLSNILENAYVACEKSNLPERHITLNASTDEQRLLIELRNTVSDETQFQDGMPVSTKKNGGTGTQSVKNIVTSHRGMVEYSQCEGEFVSRIILPLNVDEKNDIS